VAFLHAELDRVGPQKAVLAAYKSRRPADIRALRR